MSKRIVLSATERGELVLRLLRKEATAGQLAREVAQRDQLIGEMSVALRTLKKVWAFPIDRYRASLYPV